jgi:mono/diheme cytochrome c family protein
MSKIRRRVFAAGLPTLSSLSLRAQGWQVPKPSTDLTANPETDKALFEKHCASCHGVDLKGGDKGRPLLHRVYEPSHHADAAFQLVVRNGVRAHRWQVGDMAPVPQATPHDVAHITAYVRTEQRKVGIR